MSARISPVLLFCLAVSTVGCHHNLVTITIGNISINRQTMSAKDYCLMTRPADLKRIRLVPFCNAVLGGSDGERLGER